MMNILIPFALFLVFVGICLLIRSLWTLATKDPYDYYDCRNLVSSKQGVDFNELFDSYYGEEWRFIFENGLRKFRRRRHLEWEKKVGSAWVEVDDLDADTLESIFVFDRKHFPHAR